MVNIDSLEKLLSELRKDVSKAYKLRGGESFNSYFDCYKSGASPYVQNGFLDKKKVSKRFMSETAMLHAVTALFEEWCLIHEIGGAKNYFDSHSEGIYFSWYKISEPLKKQISEWVIDNPDIQDAPQIVSLLAENTLAGLRKHSLGEFYTPTNISEHLYTLTNFKPRNITIKKVVDPACGSGNLLRILVSDVVKLVSEGKLDPVLALTALNENVYGYDIQPVAILMTKLQLLLVSLPLLEKLENSSENIYDVLPFENIKLTDPLSNAQEYWDIFAKFDLVIGNPPYQKVIKENLPYYKTFQDIFSGQPNLYQMFLWWAIRSTRADGTITFLIPQSIRSGQYFSKLRKEISNHCDIKAVTSFTAQEGVFDSVRQQMMIVSLVKQKSPKPSMVTVRKGFNGNGLNDIKEIRLSQNQVVFQNDGESIWCVSDSSIDYQILSKVYKETNLLRDFDNFEILNGGFVWNQNKSSLRSHNIGEAFFVPLISAGSIDAFEFTFPPKDERLTDRIFVERAYGINQTGYSKRSILIQRTTPRKMQGRRIIACEMPKEFLDAYPVYFCENHVNLILPKGESNKYLSGLAIWLNSKLANFVFGMMNGSSHISKYELGLLPISLNLLGALSSIKAKNKGARIAKGDDINYSYYNLNLAQIKRINQLIPSLN